MKSIPIKKFLISTITIASLLTLVGLEGKANANNNLSGSWIGCDGRVVTFNQNGNEYTGRYTELGGLAPYHFTLNEVGYTATRISENQYTGQVKWRWTSGAQEWRSNTITINGNQYIDTSSDSCSRNMRRY